MPLLDDSRWSQWTALSLFSRLWLASLTINSDASHGTFRSLVAAMTGGISRLILCAWGEDYRRGEPSRRITRTYVAVSSRGDTSVIYSYAYGSQPTGQTRIGENERVRLAMRVVAFPLQATTITRRAARWRPTRLCPALYTVSRKHPKAPSAPPRSRKPRVSTMLELG